MTRNSSAGRQMVRIRCTVLAGAITVVLGGGVTTLVTLTTGTTGAVTATATHAAKAGLIPASVVSADTIAPPECGGPGPDTSALRALGIDLPPSPPLPPCGKAVPPPKCGAPGPDTSALRALGIDLPPSPKLPAC
jgi:hypothetical protein